MNKTKKIILAFLLVFAVVFVMPVTMNSLHSYASVQAAKIKISTSSKTLYVGYGGKLNITGTSKKAKWSSTNSKVASVSKSGYVKANNVGTTTIKAVVNKKTYKCKITVKQTAYVDIYDSRSMKIMGVSSKVKYTSSNSKIASVDKNGKVTGKKPGYVTITAKLKDRKYSCRLRVYANGWAKDSKGNIYYYKNEKRVEGWQYIDGYKYYFYKNCGILDQNVADRLKGKQNYYIHVNRKECKITIFAQDGENGYTIPVMAMTCSVGKSRNATPKGTFNTMSKTRWGLLMGPSYGQYCTRIVDSILFHSVPGTKKSSYNISYRDYNKLGTPASHGCIRLTVKDAKWIYDNCRVGTVVTIDDKSDGCKFAKPKAKKLKASQHYDPTDPNVKRK